MARSRRRRDRQARRIGDANQILSISAALIVLVGISLVLFHRLELWRFAGPICVLAGTVFYAGRMHAAAFRDAKQPANPGPASDPWHLVARRSPDPRR